MRILVIADTHTNVKRASQIIDKIGPAGLIIHLGDGIEDIYTISQRLPCKYIGVLGNEDRGDRYNDIPYEITIEIENIKIFCTHGHLFDLNPYYTGEKWEEGMDALVTRAKGENAKIVLFGHTHRPCLEERDGMILMNPGDVYPGERWAHIGVITAMEGAREAREVTFEIYRFDKEGRSELFLSYPD